MYPQLHHPAPAALGDPQLRRALVYAIDRQQIADELSAGYSPVAHSIIAPDQPQYAFVESSIVRYDYDPRRAVQLIEGLGFTRGPDGMFRDGNGERLTVKIQTTVNDTSQKTTLAAADYWQRIGVTGDTMVLSPAAGGRPDRWAYTGFDLVNQGHGVDGITNLLHSSAAPLPERNYQAPAAARNRGSYVNPEYDVLMDRYLATIPVPERMQALAQLVRWQTDLQLVTGFFYSVNAILLSNRLENTHPGTGWNAHEWDVRRG
jgi:peptide/nickel transport system substrate-binding protein